MENDFQEHPKRQFDHPPLITTKTGLIKLEHPGSMPLSNMSNAGSIPYNNNISPIDPKNMAPHEESSAISKDATTDSSSKLSHWLASGMRPSGQRINIPEVKNIAYKYNFSIDQLTYSQFKSSEKVLDLIDNSPEEKLRGMSGSTLRETEAVTNSQEEVSQTLLGDSVELT